MTFNLNQTELAKTAFLNTPTNRMGNEKFSPEH